MIFTILDQALKFEAERKRALKLKEEEEERIRKNAQARDQLFIKQMEILEEKIKQGDAARAKEMEKIISAGGDETTMKTLKALEDRLFQAESMLAAKKSTSFLTQFFFFEYSFYTLPFFFFSMTETNVF